jgi:hypothetical protein
MLDRLSEASRLAIEAASNFAREKTSTGTSASDEDNWFKTIACGLLGKPGLELHLISGSDESLCYKYASGKVKPPGYFIRTLLRSEQGAQFLAALMDGCEAQWWGEHQRALKIGRAAIAADE